MKGTDTVSKTAQTILRYVLKGQNATMPVILSRSVLLFQEHVQEVPPHAVSMTSALKVSSRTTGRAERMLSARAVSAKRVFVRQEPVQKTKTAAVTSWNVTAGTA